LTASPAILPSWSSHSPTWIPIRASRPSVRTPSTIACAARIARAVPSKVAKNPSPAVSRSWPRNRASSRRTIAWWRASRSRQARSPTRTAWSVEPTMSVKTTVASRRRRRAAPASRTWRTASRRSWLARDHLCSGRGNDGHGVPSTGVDRRSGTDDRCAGRSGHRRVAPLRGRGKRLVLPIGVEATRTADALLNQGRVPSELQREVQRATAVVATMATFDVRSRSVKRSVGRWIPLNHAL
jgi:hypothetical protein